MIRILLKTVLILMTLLPQEVRGKELFISSTKIHKKPPTYYILSIGVNEYKDGFWPRLKWAKADALTVGKKIGQNTGFRRDVTLLLNSEATLDHTRNALKNIALKVLPRDIVVIYISGHGTLVQSEDGELKKVAVLSNTKKKSIHKTSLYHKELLEWLDSINASRKLLILASCHSGVGKSKLSPQIKKLLAGSKGKTITLEEVSEGALVLSAATKDESAREDDKFKRDVYTHFLLESLSLHDRNGDGMVSAMEAHDYAKEKTWAYTKGRQRPTVEAKIVGNMEIPLHGKSNKKGLPILEAYDESLAGFKIEVNDGVKGRLPLAFPLKQGDSIVSIYAPRSPKAMAKYKVYSEKGETVTIDEILAPPPFRLSTQIKISQWQDDTFNKLTGSPSTTGMGFEFFYIKRGFSAGINTMIPQSLSGNIEYEIESDVQFNSSSLLLGYGWGIGDKFELSALGGWGKENMKLTFEDNLGTKMTFEEVSPLLSLRLSARLKLFSSFSLSLELEKVRSQWDFGEIGQLDGDRDNLNLSFSFHFGGRARRIK